MPIEDAACVHQQGAARNNKKGTKRTRSKALGGSVEDMARPLLRRRLHTTRSTTPSSSCRTPPKRVQGKKKDRLALRNLQQAARPSAHAKVEMRDIKAIVINLERRADRMVGCAGRLADHCPWLQYSRFPACDGKAEKMSPAQVVSSWHTGRNVVYQRRRAIRKGWDDLDTYKERTLQLSPGEQGCAVSHIRAWQHCLQQWGNKEMPLLVLEDDAAPTPEFTAKLQAALASVPADAHVLYLGYSQAAEWRRDVSEDVVESEYVWTTVGYIVWPAGARLMLSRLPIDQPVDNWMAGLNASGELKAYCVRPKIVRQADAWNVNSDVPHSDEHYWGPDSDIRHSDEFYWGPEAERQTDSTVTPNERDSAPSGRHNTRGSLFWDIDSASEESADDF